MKCSAGVPTRRAINPHADSNGARSAKMNGSASATAFRAKY